MAIALLLLVLAVPAHSAIELQGLHAYADRESAPVGETIRFHVSSQVPYRFGVSKLGLRVDDRVSDETILPAKKMSPAHVQAIYPGSYVRVKNGLPPDAKLMTLECWVRPWKLSPWQGILTQHDYPERCGFGLFLDAEGRAVCTIATASSPGRSSTIANGIILSGFGKAQPRSPRFGWTANAPPSGRRRTASRHARPGLPGCGLRPTANVA
jgi:hypothetical protein